MTIDAPDWQRIITTVEAMGDVPDAPDWERIAVAPGGGPVGQVGFAGSPFSNYVAIGYAGLSIDPMIPMANRGPTGGKLNLFTFTALLSTTVNYITFYVGEPGTPTANENFVFMYDWGQATANTYTLLGQSAAGVLEPLIPTNGIVKCPLTSGVPIVAGQQYVMGFLFNGTTPQLAGLSTSDGRIMNPLLVAKPISTINTTTTFTSPPSTFAWSASAIQGTMYLCLCSNA